MKPEVEFVDSYTPEEFQKLPAWKRIQLMKEKEEKDANKVDEQVGLSDAATKEQDDETAGKAAVETAEFYTPEEFKKLPAWKRVELMKEWGENYPNHVSEITASRADEVTKERKCKKCFIPIGMTQTECTNCGAYNPISREVYAGGSGMVYAPAPEDYPMLWFKFVIYFQLFASCVTNVLSGIGYLNGISYGGDAELLYHLSPALKSADTFYAVALFAVAIFSLVVRFRLAGYHSDGPKLYLTLLASHIVIPVIYALMVGNVGTIVVDGGWFVGDITYTFNAWPNVLGGVIGSAIVLICNFVYFGKREDLFVY